MAKKQSTKAWLFEQIETMDAETLKRTVRRLAEALEREDAETLHLLFGKEMNATPQEESMTTEELLSYQPILDAKNQTISHGKYVIELSKGFGENSESLQTYTYGFYNFEKNMPYRPASWAWTFRAEFENGALKSVLSSSTDWVGDVSQSYISQQEFRELLDRHKQEKD